MTFIPLAPRRRVVRPSSRLRTRPASLSRTFSRSRGLLWGAAIWLLATAGHAHAPTAPAVWPDPVASLLHPVRAVHGAPVAISPIPVALPAEVPALDGDRDFAPPPVERAHPEEVPAYHFTDEPYQDPEEYTGHEEAQPDERIAFGSVRIPRSLVETILRAADATGVDPVYMLALADKESSFSPTVKAGTSSAVGLFQFIERTWLGVVREHGPRHGLGAAAAAIDIVDGRPAIQDAGLRTRILALRHDPYLSAVMAAEMLKNDKSHIERLLGRDLERTEYYLAHFFGVESAGRFMQFVAQSPEQTAATLFPAAARANRALFFRREGRTMKKLTVAEVYEKIDSMMVKRYGRYQGVQLSDFVTERF